MPSPVSSTRTQTYEPAARPASWRGSVVSTAAAILMTPPPGMASRELATRLSMLLSNWLGSVRMRGRLAARAILRKICGPAACCSRPCRPDSSTATSTACVFNSCCRAKAIMRWVSEAPRSEEHTSELQSQSNLVCRLLLEKKKKKKHQSYDLDI